MAESTPAIARSSVIAQVDTSSANKLQVLYDYLAGEPAWPTDPSTVAGPYLAELNRRIDDRGIHGLHALIEGMTRGGVPFADVRPALRVVLSGRARALMIVMDNLEDLHNQIESIKPVLAGLFHAVGRMAGPQRKHWPFALQVCLPSELWEQLHVISANPEKDFGRNFLTIFWTANELLHLAATRFRIFMEIHHPQQLDFMRRTATSDEALLRAALPSTFRNGLGIEENPVAYLMRHTQLLPRHLIVILNSVFTASARGSVPWSVSESAVLAGTREGEDVIATGIFAAHSLAYPYAREVLRKMANRLNICFAASDLHKVFNQEGIRKLTGGDYDDFVKMLITLGVLGVKIGETTRYNNAEFQYTFDSSLNPQEDSDQLCFHPLFTRSQFVHSLRRLISQGERPTYPYGTDTEKDHSDYRSRMAPYALRAGGF